MICIGFCHVLNLRLNKQVVFELVIEAFKFVYAKRRELADPSKINITVLC